MSYPTSKCPTCGELLRAAEGGGWEHDTVPGPDSPCHTPAWVCQYCDGPIEYVTRSLDRDVHGALAGLGGWRHVTREPGPVHSAYPARG